MTASAHPGVESVLFDLDGTLLDTLDDIADSANAVLAARGHPTHAGDAYKRFVGNGVRVLVQRILPEGAAEEEVEAAVGAFREEYGRRWARKTRPYPGVGRLLDGLFERGLPVGILSNKPEDFTKRTVEHFLPGRLFALVWGERPGLPKKPDPRGALAACAALGHPPAKSLFCGDTATDMETAVRAGMIPVGALWGFRDEAELERAGAHAVLERPEDLLRLL